MSFRRNRNTTNLTRIKDLYLSGKHNTSFGGQSTVSRFFDKVPAAELVKMMDSVDTYSRYKPVKPPPIYNPIFTRKKRVNLQMDLLEIRNLSKWNDGISFILVLIDSFSRRLFIEPMKNKTMGETAKLLKKIIKRLAPLPEEGSILCADMGLEFRNSQVLKLLKENNIKLIHSRTEKCSLAERIILSLKRIIMQYLTENETRRYINRLSDFENIINQRYHRMIGCTPAAADMPKNRNKVLDITQRRYNKTITKPFSKKKPKFKIDQLVRFANKITFQKRGYDEARKLEVCRVKAVLTNLPVIMYELCEWDYTPIIGRFYTSELTAFRGDSFKISEIIKTRKRSGVEEYYVSWLGFPSKYNEWVTRDKITTDSYDAFRKKAKK